MSNATNDELLPLVEVVSHVPGRATYPTVFGWCTGGVRGVKMEHRRIGGRIYSSVGAVERFLRKLDERAGSVVAAPTHTAAVAAVA